MLFATYIDDLLCDLRMSGYGLHIGTLFVGAIAYADDLWILSCYCYGLQKMLDICSAYGIEWDSQAAIVLYFVFLPSLVSHFFTYVHFLRNTIKLVVKFWATFLLKC